MSHLKKEN